MANVTRDRLRILVVIGLGLFLVLPPASWLVERDVAEGRDELNFSRWDRDAGEADDALRQMDD